MSCSDLLLVLTTAQYRPIGKARQNTARTAAPAQRIRSPRWLTTRSPIRWLPYVRPVVAQEVVK